LIGVHSSSAGRIAVAIGLLAGLASGLLGVGGGFLMVPLQTMWARTDQHRATGTSLAAIVPVALVAVGAYYLASGTPQVNLPVGAALAAGGAVGATAGSIAAARIPERALRAFVAILLAAVGLKELYDALVAGLAIHAATAAGMGIEQYVLIAVCGLVIGILSGLAGLGGGIFMVPTLVIGFGISQRIAQGTSLVAILPTAAIGAVIHHRNGEVDWRAARVMAAAGVPFAIAGALVALWVPQRVLVGLFGAFLVVAAARTWPRGARPGAGRNA
jgi:uncharacterized membrane protein YfcA